VAKGTSVLAKVRAICRALPDTRETLTWGQPHFRVGEKIFCGCGDEKGKLTVGVKLERDHADAIVQDDRFTRAPYVGHKGWVSIDAARITDWRVVKALIHESYGLIAPKKTLAKLASPAAVKPLARAAKRPAAKRPAAKRPAAKRPAARRR
jgi:predicted DNA-binding protein (MmcQ/YjbR family)